MPSVKTEYKIFWAFQRGEELVVKRKSKDSILKTERFYFFKFSTI